MITKKIPLFTLTILFLSLVSCTGNGEGNSDKQAEIVPAFYSSVKTIKASYETRIEMLTLTGQVEYDSDKVINYYPLTEGVAGRVYFSLGDKVEKGQALLDIHSKDLSELQSEQSSLQSEIRIIERELKSAQEMFKDKMLSEKELLEIEAKLKQSQTSLSKVKNDMQLFGSDKGNGVFSIKAPMSGYIVTKNVTSGSTLSSDNGSLFTIADLSTVWVVVNVYAGNLQLVKEGMDVNFTTLSYPNETFEGKINLMSQVFDPEDKVLKARIIISNKDLKLKPGMSTIVYLKNEVGEKNIAIPSDALIFDKDHYFVIIKNTNGDFQIREVFLKGHSGQTTYIKSGLSEGEEVVISNHLLIYSGLNNK